MYLHDLLVFPRSLVVLPSTAQMMIITHCCRFLCAQVGLSQSTIDDRERTVALGRLTTSYTVGAVIGPTLGGWLGASGDYYFGAKLAVGGSLLAACLSCFLSPKVNDQKMDDISQKSGGEEKTTKPVSFFTKVSGIVRLVWLILFAKAITSVANSIGSTTMPLVLKDNFSMSEQSLGIIMSVMSGISAFVNGFLLGGIIEWIGSSGAVCSLCVLNMCIFSLLQAMMALPWAISVDTFSNGFGSYIGLTFIVSIFQYVLATTLTSESTSRIADSSKGTLIGK